MKSPGSQGRQTAVCLFPGGPVRVPGRGAGPVPGAGVPPAPGRGDRDPTGHNERGGPADTAPTPPPAAIWCRKQPSGDGVLLSLCVRGPRPFSRRLSPGAAGAPSASPRAPRRERDREWGMGSGGTICRGRPSGTASRGPPGGSGAAGWVRGLPRERARPSPRSQRGAGSIN